MIHRKLVIAAVALVSAVAFSAEPTFLKLTVQEKGYTQPNVKVNIPLSLIEVVADAINEETLNLGEIDAAFVELKQKDGIDIRKLWDGIKKLGPTDFIEVENEKEHVKVWKDSKDFRITVTEKGMKEPNVLVTMPLSIVESVIGDGTKPVTLKGIIAELKKTAPLSLVEVHDQDEHVKIWLE